MYGVLPLGRYGVRSSEKRSCPAIRTLNSSTAKPNEALSFRLQHHPFLLLHLAFSSPAQQTTDGADPQLLTSADQCRVSRITHLKVPVRRAQMCPLLSTAVHCCPTVQCPFVQLPTPASQGSLGIPDIPQPTAARDPSCLLPFILVSLVRSDLPLSYLELP